MSEQIRAIAHIPIEVTASEATMGGFSMQDFAGGILHTPSGAAAATITVYVCDTIDGTYTTVEPHDSTTDITFTLTPGTAKELPPQLFAAHFIKLVPSAINAGFTKWYIAAKG